MFKIDIYSSSIPRFVLASLPTYDVTLHNILLKNHEFLDDPNISHTTWHVWGLVMGYTHVNAQFQVISLNIPKDN